MGSHGVSDTSDEDTEDNVTIEITPFGNGSRNDGGAGGGEGALEK